MFLFANDLIYRGCSTGSHSRSGGLSCLLGQGSAYRYLSWYPALAQCLSKPENCQGVLELYCVQMRALPAVVPRIRDEGWCPGATTITNLSWVQEQ